MEKKRPPSMLASILQTVAPEIGATVEVEPVWGIVGRITFKNGRVSHFKYNTLDINPAGSSEIAKDKDYTNFFIESLGYPVVPGSKAFYSHEWAEAVGAPERSVEGAIQYAEALGFPVIVKPNSGSQGAGVSLAYNKEELALSLERIFQTDRIALVQTYVQGKDYRLVVLDEELVTAYERTPLSIVGNGSSSLAELIDEKLESLRSLGREVKLKREDPRILAKLARFECSLDSVPPSGEQVPLLENANLSTGGGATDVTEYVHPEFKKIAINLARDMGLRLCGVDLLVQGEISEVPEKYCVLEINASPGLDHYSKLGGEQKEITRNLYLEVLKRIEKNYR